MLSTEWNLSCLKISC